MRLPAFIRQQMDAILEAWDAFARSVAPPGTELSPGALRDHARCMLLEIADGMETAQSEREQRLKSEGRGAHGLEAGSAAAEHGTQRESRDFSPLQLSAEFRALRATVLRLWLPTVPHDAPTTVQDMLRFNEAIDKALAESIVAFSEHTHRTRDLFLAVLGHDLRSPLAGILLGGERLAQQDVPPERAARIGANVARAAKVMTHIINDLIGYASSQLGHGLPIVRATCDLPEVLNSAIADAVATHPDNHYDLHAAPGLTGRFDRVRLYQMLLNLLVNAGRHSTRGRPVVVRAGNDGTCHVIEVTNWGEPIPPEKLEEVFRPLVQLSSDDGSHRPRTSLGLGLFIAREVARGHGGSIHVRSSASEGTTFSVRLPRDGGQAGETGSPA